MIYFNSFIFRNSAFDFLVYFFAEVFPFFLIAFSLFYFVFIKKNLMAMLSETFIVFAGWATAEILKFIFAKPRPFLSISEFIPLFTSEGLSFPSSHATVFSALAVVMFFENKKLGIFFIIGAVLIGLARVVAGVHYPLDILAGFLLGALGVVIVYKYTGKLRNK